MEIPPPVPIEFKDRKAGLIIFGSLTFLAGCISALFIPLTIFAQTMAPANGPQLNSHAIIAGVVMHALAAVVLIWLGIGSILARRWARALLLIGAWSALTIGIPSLGLMAFMVRRMPELMRSTQQPDQSPMPPGMETIVVIVMLTTCFFFYVLLPSIWIAFYGSRHVKATCEARDPVVRWTDTCPLPVLAVSLWLCFGILTMLTLPIAYHGVFAFFGTFLTGIPGSIASLALAAILCYCARAFYKLEIRGWWLLVATLVIFSISTAFTYSRHDISEMYRVIGYPEQQIALIQKISFVTTDMIAWGTLVSLALTACYLVYVRRFFPRGAIAPATP
jgi:hypothetical protein